MSASRRYSKQLAEKFIIFFFWKYYSTYQSQTPLHISHEMSLSLCSSIMFTFENVRAEDIRNAAEGGILKSLLTTDFAIQNGCDADFREF